MVQTIFYGLQYKVLEIFQLGYSEVSTLKEITVFKSELIHFEIRTESGTLPRDLRTLTLEF